MICCLNKMDDKSTNYSEERYKEIKDELTKFLGKCGYKTDAIPFIPISGMYSILHILYYIYTVLYTLYVYTCILFFYVYIY
jgi:hypothetical protein